MSEAIPGQPVEAGCDGIEQADVPCRRDELPDGSVVTRSGYLLGASTYRFLTVRVAADGFVTETLDDVQAQSWPEAEASAAAHAMRRRTALVQDPTLTFPAPVHTPPSPRPAEPDAQARSLTIVDEVGDGVDHAGRPVGEASRPGRARSSRCRPGSCAARPPAR